MPGFLTGLRVRRREGVGAIVFANASSGALSLALATDLVEAVLDAEPSLASAWVPEQPRPDLEHLLGLWWSEGAPITFFVREGELWSRLSDDDALSETRYAAEPAEGARPSDRFRAVEGRERGELLEVVRSAISLPRRRRFWAMAASVNSNCAPRGPRSLSRSSRRMRFRCANSISTFLRSRRVWVNASVLASARATSRASSFISRGTLRCGDVAQHLDLSGHGPQS